MTWLEPGINFSTVFSVNKRFVFAIVRLYQICYLANYREGKPLPCTKDYLDCARWRIPSD